MLRLLPIWCALALPALAQDLQWSRNPSNGHWYGIPYLQSTWSAGEAQAGQEGGHLATIRNGNENAWIAAHFAGFNPPGYWIGLNDIAVEGTFVWSSGEPVTYTRWLPGAPDNGLGVQDCACLLPAQSWSWDDQDGTLSTALIPLIEVGQVPVTGWTLPDADATQNHPGYLATGDLNEDGIQDIVVPNIGSSSMSVFLGQGGGSFGPAVVIPTPADPQWIELADFNQDNHIDAAIACRQAMTVRILFGDGHGAFPNAMSLPLSGAGHGLAVPDLDGDGRPEIVATITSPQEALQVFHNDGGGAFAPPQTYATGGFPLYVSTGDLDNDGDVDLVVCNYGSADTQVYLNQGNGTLAALPSFLTGNQPSRVAISDFNLDGLPDLAVPSRVDGTVRIWWGSGGGTFQSGPLLASGPGSIWATAADLDGDGRADLAIANFAEGSATVYYLRPGAVFEGPHKLFAAAGAVCVRATDLNGDGRPDLAITAYDAGQLVNISKLSRDCNANGVDDPRDVALGTSPDCNANGVPDECDLAPGQPFDCDANGLIDSCEIAANGTLDINHNGILDRCDVAGVPYCFGDGTGAACPCDPGQAGLPGHGCSNSAGTGGRLQAAGVASVATDLVTLHATGLSPSTTGLFFQGNLQQNGPFGAPFGDGLLCVNQSVKRLGVRSATNGVIMFGHGVLGDPSIAAMGQVPASGATRFYQLWFRDAASFCTPAVFNLTNGVRIDWTP